MDLDASTVAGWGRKLEFPLAALGFGMGATEKNPGSNYAQRTANFLTALGIGGVQIPGPNDTTYTSQSGQLTFKPTGFLNKGLAAAVILYFAKELVGTAGIAGSIVKIAHDVGMPIAVGYSLGGFLDPPPRTSGTTYSNQNTGGDIADRAAAFNKQLEMSGVIR